MTIELATRIADEVANRAFLQNIYFWLALLACAIISFIAAYFGSYMRKKGENLATKEDFDVLLDQLQATTRTTELIKTEVSSADWSSREFKRIRREKIEVLFQAVLDVEQWRDQARAHYLFGAEMSLPVRPTDRARMLQKLYFPELRAPIGALSLALQASHLQMMDVCKKLIGESTGSRIKILDGHSDAIQADSKKVLEAISSASEAIAALVGSLYQEGDATKRGR